MCDIDIFYCVKLTFETDSRALAISTTKNFSRKLLVTVYFSIWKIFNGLSYILWKMHNNIPILFLYTPIIFFLAIVTLLLFFFFINYKLYIKKFPQYFLLQVKFQKL